MARIIEEFPAKWRRRRYPWDEWLDGKPRVLTQGEDFTVGLVAMQRHFARTAKERDLQGHTRIISATEIAVQAVARDAAENLATSPPRWQHGGDDRAVQTEEARLEERWLTVADGGAGAAGRSELLSEEMAGPDEISANTGQ
jgi:hypothetical protein